METKTHKMIYDDYIVNYKVVNEKPLIVDISGGRYMNQTKYKLLSGVLKGYFKYHKHD